MLRSIGMILSDRPPRSWERDKRVNKMAYTHRTNKSWSQLNVELDDEFRKWGVTEWETNYPKGARSQAMYQMPDDRFVSLRYVKHGREVTLTMNKQNRAVDNLAVLLLGIQSLRLNEKRGIGEIMAQAYAQLPSPDSTVTWTAKVFVENAYDYLGVNESADMAVVEAAYKAKARKAHPDAGGSAAEMAKLNQAMEAIRQHRKVAS